MMDWLIHNYLTRGFWGDEAWTALISSLPISEIVRVTGEDFHPPFYYLLVHGFIQLFGASEWIRLISVVFWLCIPLPVFGLIRKAAGRTVAWGGTLLVFFAPILFIYAFEARAYALLAFLSVLTSMFFWKSMATKRRWWLVAYGMAAIIGMYTHYYMWFIIAAHGFSWLLLYRQRFWHYLLVFGSLLLAQLPWIPTLLSQVATVKQSYWIGPINSRTHWEWFVRIMGGDTDQPQRMFVVWVLLLCLIVSPALMRWRYCRWPKAYLYLWVWLLVPVLIPTAISLVYRPVFFYRYLIFGSIPALLIVVWGLAALRKSAACGGVAFLLAFYLSINRLNFGRFPYSMREELDRVLNDDKKAEILVTTLPAFAEVMHYSHNRLPVRVVPAGLVQFSGKALLDAYERFGKVTVGPVDEKVNYWLIEPGPKSSYNGTLPQ